MPDYLKEYQVAGYECDRNSILSIGTIFNWLQDSMDKYSRTVGIDYDFCHQNNLTYILKNYDVVIHNLPRWSQLVQMHTQLIGSSLTSLFFNQTLSDLQTKQELFSSTSQVVLINTLNGHPARVRQCLPIDQLESIHIKPNFEHFDPIQRIDHQSTQAVETDHIDFNQHVNNTNYVIFAARSLSPEFLKKMQLKRIQAAYRQSAKMGDILCTQSQMGTEHTDHQIVSQENPDIQYARVRFHWTAKDR